MEEEEIVIERGVKQGGVLSPQLFNFYINDLLERIQNTGLGIRCGNTNLPIMGYCDDIQILNNLISELQKLVDMCNEYSKKFLMDIPYESHITVLKKIDIETLHKH